MTWSTLPQLGLCFIQKPRKNLRCWKLYKRRAPENHSQLCDATLFFPSPPLTNCVAKLQNFFQVMSNVYIVDARKWQLIWHELNKWVKKKRCCLISSQVFVRSVISRSFICFYNLSKENHNETFDSRGRSSHRPTIAQRPAKRNHRVKRYMCTLSSPNPNKYERRLQAGSKGARRAPYVGPFTPGLSVITLFRRRGRPLSPLWE